ncbi:MAG: response regulator [Leptospiraceae bacterium]|nr:response regulator [Leptospiraceae bacterium]MCP5496021.1 response regulator [Leptospiraceae bacterium]
MEKVYIASIVNSQKKIFTNICEQNNLQTYTMSNESSLIEEVLEIKPDILFIQTSLLETSDDNPIEKIKENKELENLWVIIYGTRDNGMEMLPRYEGDYYVHLPYANLQMEALFRQLLNKPKLILIVCKDPQKFESLHKRLLNEKFEVIISTSGKESLDRIKGVFPDLILYDEKIKDINVVSFCETIKSTQIINHIPFVVLSDQRIAENAEQYFEVGVGDIFFHPYDSNQNIQKIISMVTPPPKGKKLKALVVDDSQAVRNVISKMFKQLGFSVATAENGYEGLVAAGKDKPDIITSDYDMPVMNGWDFCSEIKKNPGLSDIPIIMVTTRSTKIDIKKGEALGVVDYLPKPFKTEDLQKIIQEVITRAKEEKKNLLISKYVSTDALKNAGDVVEGIKERKPESKFISILFSDIVSFSTLCENHTPEWIVNLLNKFFDSIIEALQKNNAIIDKMIGDAIVARFDTGDKAADALYAVKSAWDMLKTLDELNKTSDEALQIRIGINSGEVILGNIGSEKHRLDYTMIGDNVNIAQRLESNAPKKGCLLSEATFTLISEKIRVGERQVYTVKGKKEGVAAYILRGFNE